MTVTTTEPVVTKPVVTKAAKVAEPEPEVNSASVHKRIEEILKEYDNKESDIPLTHHYWNLLNQYRRLRSEENAI